MPRLDTEVMQQPFAIAVLLLMVLTAGCGSTQGFNRTAMSDVLHVDPTSNQDTHVPSHQGPTPSPPFRLGVFFTNHDFPTHQSLRKVEWLSADREHLLQNLVPLRDQRILTDIVVLMDSTIRAADIPQIRQVGARYGADAVLIIDGAAAVDRYNNHFAWLYPTIIGAYLAPGTESHALVMATGGLWAVRSEWHAPIQIVEGVSKVVGSAVFVDDAAALEDAKRQTIQALGKRIADQLQLWVQNPPPSLSPLR